MTDTNTTGNADPAATRVGRIIITGGASGLGAAIADAVARAGGTPIVLDRVVPEAAPYETHEADVSETRALESLITRLAGEHGGLDGVVTAAGIDRPGRLDDIDGDDWERVIRVNLLGTAATVRAALPHLAASGGRVVTVASTLAVKGVSDATAYCASKFGVLGLSRALAAETKGRVGVTTLIPGGMSTHFFDDRDEQYRPGADAKLNAPEHVAQAVVFALSQPPGCEIRELVVCHSEESSWP
jgi:NAD(P)-dependent dehydrogenase (short-subunit alcohol dehydrogenase family)